MLGGVTRYRTSIVVCLLLLLTVVTHPDFDLSDAKTHLGHSSLHVAFLITGVPFVQLMVAAIFHSDFQLTAHETPPRLFFPLLC